MVGVRNNLLSFLWVHFQCILVLLTSFIELLKFNQSMMSSISLQCLCQFSKFSIKFENRLQKYSSKLRFCKIKKVEMDSHTVSSQSKRSRNNELLVWKRFLEKLVKIADPKIKSQIQILQLWILYVVKQMQVFPFYISVFQGHFKRQIIS